VELKWQGSASGSIIQSKIMDDDSSGGPFKFNMEWKMELVSTGLTSENAKDITSYGNLKTVCKYIAFITYTKFTI
jgi:hypothetical protein